MIALRETPMISISCSRKSMWTVVNGVKEASSTTPSTVSSKITGRMTIDSGGASPSPDEMRTYSRGTSVTRRVCRATADWPTRPSPNPNTSGTPSRLR